MTAREGSDRRPVSSGRGAPPRRRSPRGGEPAPPGEPARSTAPQPVRPPLVVTGSLTGPSPGPSAGAVAGPALPPAGSPRAGAVSGPGRRAPWWLRLGAWMLAVPLGLVLVGVPARKGGYLTGQKLLDVVIGRDLDRFVPLVVIVVLWAFATAVLVQVIVEVGAWRLRRRQARRAHRAGLGP